MNTPCVCGHALVDHPPAAKEPFAWPCSRCNCNYYQESNVNEDVSPGRAAFNANKRFNITREFLNTVVHNLAIISSEEVLDREEVADLISDVLVLRRRIDRLHHDYADAQIAAADRRMPSE